MILFRLPVCLPTRRIPLFGCPIPVVFPSPVDDYLDSAFDLTRVLFRNLTPSFLAHVSGDSMTGAGIHPAI